MDNLPPIGARILVHGAGQDIGIGVVTGETSDPAGCPAGDYSIVLLEEGPAVGESWYIAPENMTYLDLPDRTDLTALDAWLG